MNTIIEKSNFRCAALYFDVAAAVGVSGFFIGGQAPPVDGSGYLYIINGTEGRNAVRFIKRSNAGQGVLSGSGTRYWVMRLTT